MVISITDKRKIVHRAVEEAYPLAVGNMLEEDIRLKWDNFCKSLAPKADDNLFHTASIVITGFFNNDYYHFSGKFISMPYLKHDGRYWNLNVEECPDAELRLSVKMYGEYLRDRSKFESLVKSVLVNVNTEDKLKEQYPGLYRHIAYDYNQYNALVQVDVESIAVSVDESTFEVTPVAV